LSPEGLTTIVTRVLKHEILERVNHGELS